MQKITREAVRQIASSETVFYRGMRYYAAHAVSHVTWNESSKQYRALVKGGSQYTVIIEMEEEIIYHCNCPGNVKCSGACKHVVAAMLFIVDYEQREEIGGSEGGAARTAYDIVEYFRKREYRRLAPRLYHLELKLMVPGFMKGEDARAHLSLFAGEKRMYKVGNTRKFIEDYYQGRTMHLGKEFYYIPGECAFDEASVPILDYLTEIYEIQETFGKSNQSNLFKNQELMLSKRMLFKLLRLATGTGCRLEFRGEDFGQVSVKAHNPEVCLRLRLDGDKLILEREGQERIQSLCEDGSILLYKQCIYLPEQEYICNILPFYGALFQRDRGSLIFAGENQGAFIEKVLPVIRKSMEVLLPPELKDHYIVEPMKPVLYLDIFRLKTRCQIRARLSFVYGSFEINPLRPFSAGAYILVRDKEEEERLTRLLYNINFQVDDDAFVLKKDEDIFALMTEHVSLLENNFTLMYSKEYKTSMMFQMGEMSGRVHWNTGIDFLEMDLEYSRVPQGELEEIFSSIRLKKKYYRLKNGKFLSLLEDSADMRTLSWLVRNGQVKNGAIFFPKSSALRLEEVLKGQDKLKKDEAYQRLTEDLRAPQERVWELPKGIRAQLRSYQKVGYRWLKTLAFYHMGGILADDMGLGKTLQAILYICSNPGTLSLVVCPTSLANNWQDEFEKFAPKLHTCIVSGVPEERRMLLEECGNRGRLDVLITTYPLIRKDVEYYQGMQFDTVFIDEAQYIKNHGSLSAKAVKSVRARHRFALTGTPIENTLSELWSVFDFVMPGFFPSYRKFSELYEKPVLQGEDEERMRELKDKIRPFILRRMKRDVLPELPDKIETMRLAQMTKKQEKLYQSYLSRVQCEIEGDRELKEGKGRLQILTALTRLRQICCHPGTFVENYTGGSGKLELLMEQLPAILDGGHSVIIFSQFTSMLDIIGEALNEVGIAWYYLAGSTRAADRKRYVQGFNEGRVRVFLVSLKAGGTGLNLVGADTVIHFDPWWNPAVEEQATDRAYRIGQKKKVQVIRYVMKDSIEEKIYKLQRRKRELAEAVIDSGEVFVNSLTGQELMELFR